VASQSDPERLNGAILAVAERLLAAVAQDAGLRAGLRELAEIILAITQEPSPVPTTEVIPEGECIACERMALEGETAASAVVTIESPKPAEPLPKLLLGQPRPPDPNVPAPWASLLESKKEDDLEGIGARCRLKAEGARWAATREQLKAGDVDFRSAIAPTDREILERARELPDCHLWMNSPSFTVPLDPDAMESLALAYEVLAEAVELAVEMQIDLGGCRTSLHPILELIAQAQSSVRVAAEQVGGPEEKDQLRTHRWLKKITQREGVFVGKYMFRDERADLAGIPALRARIREHATRWRETTSGKKRRKGRFGKLRYHAGLIEQGTQLDYNWRKAIEAVDQLVGEGIPPSSPEIRELLLPILDGLPEIDDMPRSFGIVLRELDLYLASRPTGPSLATPREPNPIVEEAAELLEGKSVLLIGGIRRPDAHAALEAELKLDQLIWFETREHESINVFEPIIARPEVALVLLAIRWTSHSFGEVKRFCELYGKPLVRLPAGYNPNQVAAQILSQSSKQLGALTPSAGNPQNSHNDRT
jgi:hypothetical protein